ncbi:MAG: nucleotidyltransferase family protein, partial [Acidobacteriota bacterium]|nr:nucleotidyltransferase family protein [Acidobacteriota bacterium]
MTLGPVSGVVLAAGPSRRFGRHPPKQLARLGGRVLVRRIAEEAIASKLCQVVVVVGFAAERVEQALAELPVVIVRNPDYATGQSSSVRVGLEAVDRAAAAAMFLPVDQPCLTADVIDALLDQRQRTGAAIVVPSHAGH